MATAHPQSASAPEFRSDIEAAAFPTREYIGAMALEMARLARDEKDRDEHPPIVGDRTTAYGAPPMPTPTAGDIRRMIRARRAREP